MKTLTLHLNRDSVHPGDDIYPHDKTLQIAWSDHFHIVIVHAIVAYNVPMMQGCCCWVISSPKDLADICGERGALVTVAAEDLPQPRLLVDPDITKYLNDDGSLNLHFGYHLRVTGEEMFHHLSQSPK